VVIGRLAPEFAGSLLHRHPSVAGSSQAATMIAGDKGIAAGKKCSRIIVQHRRHPEHDSKNDA
jgi:hypothetical protein